MKNIFIAVFAFALGYLCALYSGAPVRSAAAQQVTRVNELTIPLMQKSMDSYSVSINSDPTADSISESDVWISALELAQITAQRRLNDGHDFRAWIELCLVPRTGGYQVQVFSRDPKGGRREEISRIVSEEITSAQRQSTKSLLEILQKKKSNDPRTKQP